MLPMTFSHGEVGSTATESHFRDQILTSRLVTEIEFAAFDFTEISEADSDFRFEFAQGYSPSPCGALEYDRQMLSLLAYLWIRSSHLTIVAVNRHRGEKRFQIESAAGYRETILCRLLGFWTTGGTSSNVRREIGDWRLLIRFIT